MFYFEEHRGITRLEKWEINSENLSRSWMKNSLAVIFSFGCKNSHLFFFDFWFFLIEAVGHKTRHHATCWPPPQCPWISFFRDSREVSPTSCCPFCKHKYCRIPCVCVRMCVCGWGYWKAVPLAWQRLITRTASFFAPKWAAAPLAGPSRQGDPTCPRMAGRQTGWERIGGCFAPSLLHWGHRMLAGASGPG